MASAIMRSSCSFAWRSSLSDWSWACTAVEGLRDVTLLRRSRSESRIFLPASVSCLARSAACGSSRWRVSRVAWASTVLAVAQLLGLAAIGIFRLFLSHALIDRPALEQGTCGGGFFRDLLVLVRVAELRRGQRLLAERFLGLDLLAELLPGLAERAQPIARATQQAGHADQLAGRLPLKVRRRFPLQIAFRRVIAVAELPGGIAQLPHQLHFLHRGLRLLQPFLLIGRQAVADGTQLLQQGGEIALHKTLIASQPFGAKGCRRGVAGETTTQDLGRELNVLNVQVELIAGHFLEALGRLVEVLHRVVAGEQFPEGNDDLLMPALGFLEMGRLRLAVRLAGGFQGGEDANHLLLAEAGQDARRLVEQLLFGRLVQTVVVEDANHGLETADQVVGLGPGPVFGDPSAPQGPPASRPPARTPPASKLRSGSRCTPIPARRVPDMV